MPTPLTTIDTDQHPLNWDRYSRLYNELDTAAAGFVAIGHGDLAAAMERVRAELYNAWNLIQAKEVDELNQS